MCTNARATALMLLMLLQSLACLTGIRLDQQRDMLAHAVVHGQGLDHHHHDDMADDGLNHLHAALQRASLHPDAFDVAAPETSEAPVAGAGHQHVHDGMQVAALPLTPLASPVLQASHAPPALLATPPARVVLDGLLRPPRRFLA